MDNSKLKFGYLRYHEPGKGKNYMLMIRCSEKVFRKSDSKIIIKSDGFYGGFDEYIDLSQKSDNRNEIHIMFTKKDVINDMEMYQYAKETIIDKYNQRKKELDIISEYMNHPTDLMEQYITWDKK